MRAIFRTRRARAVAGATALLTGLTGPPRRGPQQRPGPFINALRKLESQHQETGNICPVG
jgi:hypothetical protein